MLDVRGYANPAAGPATGAAAAAATGPAAGLAAGAARFTMRGPGIDGSAELAAPWAPEGFADAWQRNTELFPRGVDLLLVDSGTVTGLPRTTLLAEVEPGGPGS